MVVVDGQGGQFGGWVTDSVGVGVSDVVVVVVVVDVVA